MRGATRTRIHKSYNTISLGTDIVSQVCPKRASTNITYRSKEARPPAWEPPKLLLIGGELDVVVGATGVLLLLGSVI